MAALLLVNTFAVTGQAMWAYNHLGHSRLVAAGFAATLESISLYLTSQASAALLANDKAAGLRAAAYTVGLLVGCMNYEAHCGRHWSPTAMAIAFGLLSAISPWLWAIQSRRSHRDQLAHEGLIDPRTVKVPTALWMLYPGYAWRVLRIGVRTGVNHLPTLRTYLAEHDVLAHLTGPDAVRYAYGVLDSYHPHHARLWLAERGVHVDQAAIEAATPARAVAAAASSTPALPVPVSPGPVGQVDTDPHAAEVAAQPTKVAAITYAYGVLGNPTPGEVVRWLADRGCTVQRSEANRVGKKLDTAATEAPTGRLISFPTAGPTAVERVNGHPTTIGGGQS